MKDHFVTTEAQEAALDVKMMPSRDQITSDDKPQDSEAAFRPVQETDDKGPGTYSKMSVVLMIIFSGLAIGSDGYNASVVGNMALIFHYLFPDTYPDLKSRIANSFIVGMIVGMLGFGYLVDKLGRKGGAVLTTLILVVGLSMSTASSGKTEEGLLWMMVISRGVAGVGAGGEYPVSGAGAVEASDENAGVRKHRGLIFAIISNFSATLGFAFGGLVPLLLILCFKKNEEKYDIVWRLSFAFGLLPPLSIFWFRYKMAVSTAYRNSAAKKANLWKPILKKYWRPLLGASLSWFIYNWISYPFGIFAATIVRDLNIGDNVVQNMGWAVLITCFYAPGGVIGGLLSDRIGRRQTLMLGFFLQASLGYILGGALRHIQPILPLFIVLYGIFLALGEMGPGATMLAISSESFPTSVRGQCLGLITATGKAGAAAGTAAFAPIVESFGDDTLKASQAVYVIGSSFAILGVVVAYFLIPNISDQLDDEDEQWKAYLQAEGYEIEWGDNDTADPKGVKKEGIRS